MKSHIPTEENKMEGRHYTPFPNRDHGVSRTYVTPQPKSSLIFF
jgi:hypothetical protein